MSVHAQGEGRGFAVPGPSLTVSFCLLQGDPGVQGYPGRKVRRGAPTLLNELRCADALHDHGCKPLDSGAPRALLPLDTGLGQERVRVRRQKLAMPECLQQQLINSRVVKPRGCNEETETGERHKGRSKGREGMKRYCKSGGSWRRGRRMFPAGGSLVSPVISVLLYWCSVSKMTRPESFSISSV